MTDTIGLSFSGSQLDQTDINVICDAIDEAMFGIASETPLFSYSADGTSISADWTVTNPNTDVATFLQDDGIIMRSLAVNNGNTFANKIQTNASRSWGVWTGSLLDIEPPASSASIRSVGLFRSATKRIEIRRQVSLNATTLTFAIVNTIDVYTVDTAEADLLRWKIVYSPTHSISFYKWSNDAWVQVGVTHSDLGMLGDMYFNMATRGNDKCETILRDFHITQSDFIGVMPVSQTFTYSDIRRYGAVPDGTTDCASAINTALTAGNITIPDGTFLINSAITVPSNRSIDIKNAKIRVGNTTYDNLFRNSDFSGGNTNITIKGLGNATLDGNAANNNDSYVTHGGKDTALSYKYIGIMMSNVANLRLSGLRFVDSSHYAVLLHKINTFIVDDIYFNHYTVTANQDGCDLVWGCYDGTINNLRGYT